MFTGIITGVGQITDSQPLGDQPAHGRRRNFALAGLALTCAVERQPAVASNACRQGLGRKESNARRSQRELESHEVTRAVVTSLILILELDYFLTQVLM